MPVCLHLYHVLLPSKAKTKRYAQCGNQVPLRQNWSQQDVRGGQNHPILMFYYSNSEKNVVTDINVEKYFVSIRISDFKDKGKAFGYVQAARMSFLQDTSLFFFTHSRRSHLFLLTWFAAQ